jgi:hypothetical protein
MKRLALLSAAAAGLALSGCTPAQQTAFNNVVVAGQLFCSRVGASGPELVALANASGAPVSVIGQSSTWVAAACALVNGQPVPPPATPIPVKVVPVTPPVA